MSRTRSPCAGIPGCVHDRLWTLVEELTAILSSFARPDMGSMPDGRKNGSHEAAWTVIFLDRHLCVSRLIEGPVSQLACAYACRTAVVVEVAVLTAAS